jgi:hypothetical protein
MLQSLSDRDLDRVSGGVRVVIGNRNYKSFNTGGVDIDGYVRVDADKSNVQIGSNGGALNGNTVLLGD